MFKIAVVTLALCQAMSISGSPQGCGFKIRSYNNNHKYPDTGGWAKYNAQFKDAGSSRRKRSISETSRENNVLHTLVTAVQVAEIMDATLEGVDQFTVFSPNLAALGKLPREEFLNLLTNKESLQKILLRNIVPSIIKKEDIVDGVATEFQTIGGETVTLRKWRGNVLVTSSSANATIVTTDVFGDNGIVHVVDNVL